MANAAPLLGIEPVVIVAGAALPLLELYDGVTEVETPVNSTAPAAILVFPPEMLITMLHAAPAVGFFSSQISPLDVPLLTRAPAIAKPVVDPHQDTLLTA